MKQRNSDRKLGLVGLTALVFSMMVGSGIFNIPQNIAAGSGLAACIVAWVATAVAMLSLLYTFRHLSLRRRDLKSGIYQYAQEGFGKFAGFNMAWGYWLCVCFANVAYAVMLNDSFGAFFPVLLNHGWQMILCGSLLIWSMYFLVSNGMKTAKTLNTVMTVVKLIPMLLIVVLLVLYFKVDRLEQEWPGIQSPSDMWNQVRDTMMVTLWCFIGIEGAVMMSARAKKPSNVGTAGILGFLVAWILYAVVSILSFGLMSRMRLVGLGNPSVAYLLLDATGQFAYWFVIISVIISVLGAWVSWTIVCAQVPLEAAHAGIFPQRFAKLNKHDMPAYGLKFSSVAMTAFLIIVSLASDVYMAAVDITGMMVLPCYLFSGLYLCKLALKKDSDMRSTLPVAALCVVSCLYMLYAAGPLLMATSLFYMAGMGIYFRKHKTLSRGESIAFIAMVLLAIVSVVLICQGKLQL